MNEFVYSGKGEKLSRVLGVEMPEISYSALQKILRKGDIRINGKKVYSDCVINNGDAVRVYYKERERSFTPFFENEFIACFFKPAHLPSSGERSLEEYVFTRYGYIICHRLDTNTEGIVLFAKSDEVFAEIKKAFKNHSIEKHYLTLVYGKIQGKSEISGFLVKESEKSIVKIYDKPIQNSQRITTRYSSVYVGKNASVLDVELVTGKTHQIRAHLSHVGHPVIGDPKYCSEKINRYYGKKYQLLRAYKLIFHINEGFLACLNGLVVEYDSREYSDNLKLTSEK